MRRGRGRRRRGKGRGRVGNEWDVEEIGWGTGWMVDTVIPAPLWSWVGRQEATCLI